MEKCFSMPQGFLYLSYRGDPVPPDSVWTIEFSIHIDGTTVTEETRGETGWSKPENHPHSGHFSR